MEIVHPFLRYLKFDGNIDKKEMEIFILICAAAEIPLPKGA
ncbi:hypothetical protein [Labilibaculum antarcticum]|nr:hypothetical protein [Labilibaculum antarcticum]